MTKDEKLAKANQLLCDVQDLVESAGELGLMYKVKELRDEVTGVRFGGMC